MNKFIRKIYKLFKSILNIIFMKKLEENYKSKQKLIIYQTLIIFQIISIIIFQLP